MFGGMIALEGFIVRVKEGRSERLYTKPYADANGIEHAPNIVNRPILHPSESGMNLELMSRIRLIDSCWYMMAA